MKEINVVRLRDQETYDDLLDSIEKLREMAEKEYSSDLKMFEVHPALKSFISLWDQYMVTQDILEDLISDKYGKLVHDGEKWIIVE